MKDFLFFMLLLVATFITTALTFFPPPLKRTPVRDGEKIFLFIQDVNVNRGNLLLKVHNETFEVSDAAYVRIGTVGGLTPERLRDRWQNKKFNMSWYAELSFNRGEITTIKVMEYASH